RVEMSFGVMGGQYQAAGHARFLTNLVDYGMDPQAAIDAPRAFPQNGVLALETGYGDDVVAGLVSRGHTVERAPAPIGGAQAIRIDADGTLWGASDPRKDGIALGY
ncbi:MAG: gamma-glutamyltransferase, partial [Pseudomonadota bacterium]